MRELDGLIERSMNSGWESKTFAEVLEIRNGRNQKEVLSDDGEYPIYGSAGTLMGYATDYLCEPGTTIIGRKGSINNPIYVDTRFWNVDTAFGLSPKDGLESRFLYYFCLGYDFSGHNQGTTIPSLVKTDLLKIAIPVPPVEEQRRIVAILDGAFACIDKAKANTEKNIQNARELFDSYLNNIFSNPGPDWERRSLKELTSKIGSGATPRGGKKTYKTRGISLIRSMNVHDRRFKPDNLAFIDSKQANELSNVTLQARDVLINITGASIARSCLCPHECLPGRVNQHVSIIRAYTDKIDPSFLNFALTSNAAKERLLNVGVAGGSTRQALTKTDLEDFQIDLPGSVVEQRALSSKMILCETETKEIESRCKRKALELDYLKNSILQKAFSGAL